MSGVFTEVSSSHSSSSSSANEILYGALAEARSEKLNGEQSISSMWNFPRKTIKAVDSMGRIEEKFNFYGKKPWEKITQPKKRNEKKNKTRKSISRLRKRRLLELAKPKSIALNKLENLKPCLKERRKPTTNIKPQQTIPRSISSEKKTINVRENISKGNSMVKKKFRTSKHIDKLAEPRMRYETEIRLPGRVPETALFATASKRLIELATPKRTSLMLREKSSTRITDYGVNREALKAVCTPRISKLSVPRNPKRGVSAEEKTEFSRGDAVSSPELLAGSEKKNSENECRKKLETNSVIQNQN